MQKVIRKLGIVLALCFMVLGQFTSVSANDEGAYLVGSSATYVNPLTGSTEDGGSNVSLGESMVGSIVESTALVEQVNGAIYVTVGLGLASNVGNVRFQLMNTDGSKREASGVITGTSTANGDTVNHYRIQVDALTQYISPIMFVTPMGRDVQFFIQLNTSSKSTGTGVYNALMVPVETPSQDNAVTSDEPTTTTPKQSSNTASDKEETTTKKDTESANKTDEKETETTNKDEDKTETASKDESITKETLFENVNGISYHPLETKTSPIGLYVGIGVAVVVFGAGGVWYVKKRKK